MHLDLCHGSALLVRFLGSRRWPIGQKTKFHTGKCDPILLLPAFWAQGCWNHDNLSCDDAVRRANLSSVQCPALKCLLMRRWEWVGVRDFGQLAAQSSLAHLGPKLAVRALVGGRRILRYMNPTHKRAYGVEAGWRYRERKKGEGG